MTIVILAACAAANLLPVVPQPREWKPVAGAYRLEVDKVGYVRVGDAALGEEGYELLLSPTGTVARANGEIGFLRAKSTLQQLAASGKPVKAGTVRDWPKYRVRGIMLDVGRKFVRLETLRAIAKTAAYYKLNEFHIHLNDDAAEQFVGKDGYSAFRLECGTYPGLTAKDGHYGKYVHVGTDEYDKREAEPFRAYTDWMFRMIRRHGKEPRAWGSLTHAAGKTPVLADEKIVMDIWYNPYYGPLEALEAGYSIVSVPDCFVYIVPAAGFYFDYLEHERLYNTWEPNVVGAVTVDANHPRLLGGKFAIWNDLTGNGISEDDIFDRAFPAIQTLSQKMWSGAVEGESYADFRAIADTLGDLRVKTGK